MAPRASEENEGAKAASRTRILGAARALFAERGYAACRVADVARRAGMSAGNVYWHFDSKEALLAAILAEGFGNVEAMTAEVAAAYGPARRKLDLLLERTLALYDQNALFMVILGGLMGLGGQELIRALGFDMPGISGRYQANLRRVFAEARSEGAVAPADPTSSSPSTPPSSTACSSRTAPSGRRCHGTRCVMRPFASSAIGRPAEDAAGGRPARSRRLDQHARRRRQRPQALPDDRRVAHAAEEEDGARRHVAEREDEGPVHAQGHRLGRHGRRAHHDGGGGGGLRSLLVDVDVGLVDHVRDLQLLSGRDPAEVRPVVERRRHAERRQGSGKVRLRLDPELRSASATSVPLSAPVIAAKESAERVDSNAARSSGTMIVIASDPPTYGSRPRASRSPTRSGGMSSWP